MLRPILPLRRTPLSEVRRPVEAPVLLNSRPHGVRAAIEALPASKIGEVSNVGFGDPSVLPLWFGEGDLPTPSFIYEAATRALAALACKASASDCKARRLSATFWQARTTAARYCAPAWSRAASNWTALKGMRRTAKSARMQSRRFCRF